MKNKIITITGKPGSGKSTTSKKLSEDLKYERFSSGDYFRQVGLEKGLNVIGLSHLAEKDGSIDELIDEKVKEMGKKENIIIESRLAFHWVPKSFKVYLDLDLDTCAKRMFKDLESNPTRKASEDCESSEQMKEKLLTRFESEKIRYQNLYNVNPQDLSQYDLVVDTSINDPEEVCQIIKDKYNSWLGL